MAGTAKLISVFIMGIKPNLPEVRFVSKLWWTKFNTRCES
jgi:hypothetical protein